MGGKGMLGWERVEREGERVRAVERRMAVGLWGR